MTGNSDMPVTLRLSHAEQEALRQKCVEINKLLVKKGRQPLRDSELAHFILDNATKLVQVTANGDLRVEPE